MNVTQVSLWNEMALDLRYLHVSDPLIPKRVASSDLILSMLGRSSSRTQGRSDESVRDDLALRRAYKHAETAELTEDDVKAVLASLDHSQPVKLADFREVVTHMERAELVDFMWRQHVRIHSLLHQSPPSPKPEGS